MRSIAVILTDRANYGRLAPVMDAIESTPSLSMHVICGGSMVLNRFGQSGYRPVDVVKERHEVEAEVYHEVEGSMARSIGMGVSAYATELERINPDFVLVIGDRYETLSAAMAAVYTGCCLIHVQGGEVSGTLDESARHAITKLAHYHAPATEQARHHIIHMGECKETIISVGCPVSDLAADINPLPIDRLLVTFHPNTASDEKIEPLLSAVGRIGMPTLMLWPNIDDGSNTIHKAIRHWRVTPRPWLQMITNLAPDDYLRALASSSCCIGNSSSFVRDAGFFGTPVVLVGDRQAGREHGEHVVPITVNADAIESAVRDQLEHGRYEPSTLYGDGEVSGRIASAIGRIEPYTQKQLHYPQEMMIGG